MDNVIHRINRYPLNNCLQNKTEAVIYSVDKVIQGVIHPLNNWSMDGLPDIDTRMFGKTNTKGFGNVTELRRNFAFRYLCYQYSRILPCMVF